MKSLFLFIIVSSIIPLAQTSSQKESGLEMVSLQTKNETRKTEDRLNVVSQKPPVIKPTLGRGTADATDSRNVAQLKDKWEDQGARSQGLNAAANQREVPPRRTSVHTVYVFRAEMKNTTAKTITRFVWAYHLPDPSGISTAQDNQYLCNLTLAPGKVKSLKVVSRVPREMVVNASAPSTPSGHVPTINDMLINQIVFADNDKWQRSGWNSVILTQVGARKIGKGKCIEL